MHLSLTHKFNLFMCNKKKFLEIWNDTIISEQYTIVCVHACCLVIDALQIFLHIHIHT